ncbi:MAG: helix-turn-helix transcriptional regulator [Cyclobacteriaceae bacterium]|jgi:transcriptional regulator with XRE-family HTH domain|nr:helix-turn-helix transcriptional regulator [Cytophagales bacterium]MCZ8326445.1 helix-turn-helix transcriptional regulator [Cyclobacteriaceae bacterium]
MSSGIGSRIKHFRELKKMSQEALVDALNKIMTGQIVKRATISNYENDKTEPSIEQIRAFAKVFGIKVGELFDEETKDTFIYGILEEEPGKYIKEKQVLLEELNELNKELRASEREKQRYKDELEELKKFLPIGGEAKLKEKT